ncbi:peptidase inhibitor family I36 protein [Streptomyces sp. NPDC086554]|uniref:peptidase inhibitor family I36 protein n=1 Tax=Streptomyces sp. NPDC086554 TaxID=3154864 RepID=UPI00342E9712
MRFPRFAAYSATAVLAAGLLTLGGSATASADEEAVSMKCKTDMFCLYYQSAYKGGIADYAGGIMQYTSAIKFSGSGGQVNNNSAAVKLRDKSYHVHACQYYNYDGWCFKVWKYGTEGEGGPIGYSDWPELPASRKNAFSSHNFYR